MPDLNSLISASDEHFRIVLVCGAERTGTTLLQRILCSDPAAIPIVGELPIINIIVDAVEAARDNFDFFYADYLANPADLDFLAVVAIENLMRVTRQKYPDCSLGVLKAPAFTQQLTTIRRILPRAHFVVMLRNPMDTVASMDHVARRAKASNSAPAMATLAGDVPALTRRFLSYYAPLMSASASEMSPITFVRYEELVARPDAEVLRLSGNLRLALSLTDDKHDVMRSIYLQERLKANHRAYWSELYQLDISAARVNSYKEVLAPDERKIILDMTSDYRRWSRHPWAKKEYRDKP